MSNLRVGYMSGIPVPRSRIMLADSNPSMLAMLNDLLHEEFRIVAAVPTGAEALRSLPETRPDVVLLDVVLDDMNGFELGDRLRKIAPQAKILYLSMYDGPAFVDAAFAVGASGYVFKSQASSDLLTAIRAICRGEKFNPYKGRQSA